MWYRTLTLTISNIFTIPRAVGQMKMALFTGWTMADLGGPYVRAITDLYDYMLTYPALLPANSWVRGMNP